MAGRERIRNPKSKARILEAAERVVAKRGPANLTLDAVAAEAGLSKGGLLYNFPSKQSLIEGMLQSFCDRHRAYLAELREQDGARPNAAVRNLLAAKRDIPLDRGAKLAVLAGVAENPDLLAPLRVELAETLRELEQDSPDPRLALLVWLASDGLMFWELLGISPLDDAGRAQICAYMRSLVDDDTSTAAPAASSLNS
jgi:AcrR family transcriptional regulator